MAHIAFISKQNAYQLIYDKVKSLQTIHAVLHKNVLYNVLGLKEFYFLLSLRNKIRYLIVDWFRRKVL